MSRYKTSFIYTYSEDRSLLDLYKEEFLIDFKKPQSSSLKDINLFKNKDFGAELIKSTDNLGIGVGVLGNYYLMASNLGSKSSTIDVISKYYPNLIILERCIFETGGNECFISDNEMIIKINNGMIIDVDNVTPKELNVIFNDKIKSLYYNNVN